MKDLILNIIHQANFPEPVYALEFEYRKLARQKDKESFIEAVKSIATVGTIAERNICLTLLDMINKAGESEIIITQTVESLNLKDNQSLVPALLNLCSTISKPWAIDFILKIISSFKPDTGEFNELYNRAVRSIIKTKVWEISIDDINYILTNNNDDFFVDLLTWFKFHRSENEFRKLIVRLNVENLKRFSVLSSKV